MIDRWATIMVARATIMVARLLIISWKDYIFIYRLGKFLR